MKTLIVLAIVVMIQVVVAQLVQLITEKRKERIARLKQRASREHQRSDVERALIHSYMEVANK